MYRILSPDFEIGIVAVGRKSLSGPQPVTSWRLVVYQERGILALLRVGESLAVTFHWRRRSGILSTGVEK